MTSRCSREEKHRNGIDWHEYAVEGQRVPGVTTVLKHVGDRRGLLRWYAQQGALWALENRDNLMGLSEPELLSRAAEAPNQRRDAKAKEGKTLHAYAEALGAGQTIEPESELAARAEFLADFLDRTRARILAAETTVWHEELRYAGTFDTLADLWDGTSWARWLLDYKSGSGVYREQVLQLAAYRFADYAVVADQDKPMARVDRVGIVHVTESGWALKPVKADREAFDTFARARQNYDWLTQPEKHLISPALPHPSKPEPELEGATA